MMRLIHFELRMSHIDGPDHDWWTDADTRVRPEQEAEEVARMLAKPESYRNVWVEDDPHDQHRNTVQTSTSGLSQWCRVPGCTWSWEYV
jgi:hypothetical protein